MALIKCPECGKEISDTSDKCVNCGYVLASNAKLHGKKTNKGSIGILSVIFGFLFPIVGLILGIVGACKREKHSVYGIFISILMPIFYLVLWGNTLKPKNRTLDYNYTPSYEYNADDTDNVDDLDLDNY